ncbi:hypothetical protein FPZ44_24190 [Paenibacillus agilis]|uniref:Uncharacterized protein n=2 Tax=Paenibacillus agilis TaxID=3020863 RepID=A0A559IEP1_9BACL|nr:hypothetical protein FPZ44_24190 [Paenibacillus agilis]
MNATKQNKKANNEGKTFEELLFEMLGGGIRKKLAMAIAIEEAKEEMRKQLQAMGDMVMSSVEVEECPCERNCGAVKISAEFLALAFTRSGIEVKEGKMENILSFNK